MNVKFSFLLIISLVFLIDPCLAQFEKEPDTLPDNVLVEKQWGLGVLIHTNGWGLRFRRGKNITALRQWMLEGEFATMKSPKEVRIINPYFSDSKSYFYGKLNYLSFVRIGTGLQHILNRKPYWGGVQLSILYYGGLSVGITKPVYLYIIHSDYEVTEERYNPEEHYLDNIYGRAPFLSGILNLGFYPGIYTRAGLEFEFGNKNKRPKALETGATLDYSPIGIPLMAFNPKQHFFLTLYLSFTFGKRYN